MALFTFISLGATVAIQAFTLGLWVSTFNKHFKDKGDKE